MTLNEYIQQSLRDNWNRPALSDLQGLTLQYRDVARKIVKLHMLFDNAGLKPGDKVALCGRNTVNWGVAALACLTYGVVAVPILHDFKPDNIHHLVTHSDARMFFVDKPCWDNLDHSDMPTLVGAILLEDYSLLFSRSRKLTKARETLNELFGEKYPERFTAQDVVFTPQDEDSVCLINYTSGSTGFSKGVMLSYRSMWSNIQFCIDGLQFLKPGDGFVSLLPLAHMFGFTVELLHPFVKGCHITLLGKTPSPAVLLEALNSVKPKLVVTVPLILEKLVRTRVFPALEKPFMKVAVAIPGIRDKVYKKIRTKLIDVFGGKLIEVIIGGAGLSKEVKKFLRKISFPYTVGYGMTECGPLIAYCPWDKQRPGSCGLVVDRMETRIDSSDPSTNPGVLWVRGDNVMDGYYKNPDASEAVFDKQGWMNTGDICTIDEDGYIYIKGRDKTMILGSSGQNIYPEEIEQQLNVMPYVQESLVVDRGGRLIALIYPDKDLQARNGLSTEQLNNLMKANIAKANHLLPSYSQIVSAEIMPEEFEKTPKRSIKRYLYK